MEADVKDIRQPAAKVVSESIIGSHVTIRFGRGYYTVEQPTCWTIARMLRPLSKVVAHDKMGSLEVVALIPGNAKAICEAITWAIIGDRPWWQRIRRPRIHRLIVRKGLHMGGSDLKEAWNDVLSLIEVQDFFDCASSASELAKRMAKPRQ